MASVKYVNIPSLPNCIWGGAGKGSSQVRYCGTLLGARLCMCTVYR